MSDFEIRTHLLKLIQPKLLPSLPSFLRLWARTSFSQLPAKSAFRKKATQNLPLTGGKEVVLILLLSLVIVLMSAAGMVLAKKRVKRPVLQGKNQGVAAIKIN